MTHLETYLDCLKLLPGDLARDMSLLSSLDASLLSGQQSLRLQQQQLLEAFTNRRAALEPPPPPSSSPPPPWLSQLSAVRALEAELHLLCEEKVALALQVKEGLLSYAHRLDDETALSEKEMGGDMVREALEAGDRGKAKGGTAFAFRHGGASAKGGKGGAAMKEKGGGWREREKERERERQKAQLRSLQQQRRAEEEGDDDDLRLDPFDGEDAGDDEGRAPSTAPNLSEADAGDAADDGEGEGTGQEGLHRCLPRRQQRSGGGQRARLLLLPHPLVRRHGGLRRPGVQIRVRRTRARGGRMAVDDTPRPLS